MSDIMLNHASIDEAADALTQAGSGMHSQMEECLRAVQTAEQQLKGDLATAAHEFYTALANSDTAMTDDIIKGAEVLRTMHGLLRDADIKGGQGIGQ